MRVAIVGGGIVGLCTAWALLERGHGVVLLEASALPNPQNASTNPHRLIRYPYGDLDEYCRLVTPAFAAWERLWTSLGRSFYVETGTLALSREAGDWADRSRAGLERLGVAHRVLPPEQMRTLHPALEVDGVRWALALETGGVLLSDRIAEALVGHLEARGAELRAHTKVVALDVARHSLRLETGERIEADALVVAAGAHVAGLLPEFTERLRPNRKVNLYLQPPARLARAWEAAPIVVDLGGDSAGVLIPPVAGTPIRFGAGGADRPLPVGEGVQVSPEEARALFEHLRPSLLDADGYRPVGTLSCHHVSSPDERFIFEPIAEGSLLISGCSGHMYKFAPLLAEQAVQSLTALATSDLRARVLSGLIASSEQPTP